MPGATARIGNRSCREAAHEEAASTTASAERSRECRPRRITHVVTDIDFTLSASSVCPVRIATTRPPPPSPRAVPIAGVMRATQRNDVAHQLAQRWLRFRPDQFVALANFAARLTQRPHKGARMFTHTG